MLRPIILLFSTVLLMSCADNDAADNNTTMGDTTAIVQDSTALPKTQDVGSLAGMYVQQFAGANTHDYVLTFADGAYNGVYKEYQDGKETEVKLENIVVNETDKTIAFSQSGAQVTGRFTDAGLQIGDELYEKR